MVSMIASLNPENSSGSNERWTQSRCQAHGRKLIQNGSKKGEYGRSMSVPLIRAKKGKVKVLEWLLHASFADV